MPAHFKLYVDLIVHKRLAMAKLLIQQYTLQSAARLQLCIKSYADTAGCGMQLLLSIYILAWPKPKSIAVTSGFKASAPSQVCRKE
jgi:hypothetical protein